MKTTIKSALNTEKLPCWTKPGKFRYARIDAGPLEVAKAILSGWQYMYHPDSIHACTNFYNDETINYLMQAKINWIWVTWSVGFSDTTEQKQRSILNSFIKRCHDHNIKVSAYVSLANMFWADMFKFEPESENWIQKDEHGQPVPYGASLYSGVPTRYLACLSNEHWIDYQKVRIKKAIEAGVDAFFYDNMFYSCHCQICQTLFRDYSRKISGKEYDIPTKTRVEIKNEDRAQAREGEILSLITQDSNDHEALMLWENFCLDVMANSLAQLKTYACSLKEDILVSNNAHQRCELNNVCNAISTEDGIEPGVVEEKVYSNIILWRYLKVSSLGWKPIVVEYGIRNDRFVPMTVRKHQLSVAEAAINGGSLTVCPEGYFLNGLYYKDKEALDNWAAIAKYNSFLADNEEYFLKAERLSDVAVFWGKTYPRQIQKVLSGSHFGSVSLEVILNEDFSQDMLDDCQAVLVIDNGNTPAFTSLSERLKDYIKTDIKIFTVKTLIFEDEKAFSQLLAQVKTAVKEPICRIEGSPYVTSTVTSQQSRQRKIVHVLNYSEGIVSDIKIRIKGSADKITLITPDSHSEQIIGTKRDHGYTELMLPEVDIYSMIVLE